MPSENTDVYGKLWARTDQTSFFCLASKMWKVLVRSWARLLLVLGAVAPHTPAQFVLFLVLTGTECSFAVDCNLWLHPKMSKTTLWTTCRCAIFQLWTGIANLLSAAEWVAGSALSALACQLIHRKVVGPEQTVCLCLKVSTACCVALHNQRVVILCSDWFL